MKQQIIVERMCDFDITHTPHNEKVFPVRAIKTLICARASVVVAATPVHPNSMLMGVAGHNICRSERFHRTRNPPLAGSTLNLGARGKRK